MEDQVISHVTRLYAEQAMGLGWRTTGGHVFLGITLLIAGGVSRYYALPGALLTVGVALIISGIIEGFRVARLESRYRHLAL
jgi:hypothetical protein